MNPYKLKDVFNYLTSNNQLLKKKLKLGTSEIPIPPKKQNVIDIEAVNRFNKANPRVDTTSLKPLSVKHSNVRQSNVGQTDEGVIQGAFDTATREAQSEGFPAPNYDKFKSRYLKKNMKADGGRMGYKDGEGVITIDDKIDEMISFYKDYLNQGGKMDFKTFSKKYIPENFAEGGRAGYEDGGMLVQPSDDGSRPGYKEDKTYPFQRPDGKPDYRLGLDEKTGKYFRKVGKEDNVRIITQQEGESLEDFKNKKPDRIKDASNKNIKLRNSIDNWTKNWLDNNLSNIKLKILKE